MDGVQSYRCVCETGHTGVHCESPTDPCVPNPCHNSGHCCRQGKGWCTTQLPRDQFECFCATGYTGMYLCIGMQVCIYNLTGVNVTVCRCVCVCVCACVRACVRACIHAFVWDFHFFLRSCYKGFLRNLYILQYHFVQLLLYL